MKRIFAAIPIPSDLAQQIIAINGGIRGAHWIGKNKLHLTLRFIGNVDGIMFEDVRRALKLCVVNTFYIRLVGVQHFGNSRKIRALWVGIQRSQSLFDLRDAIESRLFDIGIESEQRKYTPHVTIARLRNSPISQIKRFLENYSIFVGEGFFVDKFYLYSTRGSNTEFPYRVEEIYNL